MAAWTVRTLCGLLLLFLECGGFNLDHDSVLRKDGDPGTYFGFSMSMHRQIKPTDKRMLLVGAPKARTLDGQKSKDPGGLYTCDFSSPSRACKRLLFDNEEDLAVESKENQWLGVTVKSQGPGGKVLVCAHRYQTRSNVNTDLETRDIDGRCYVMSQDLTFDEEAGEEDGAWAFCEGRQRGHEMFGSCQQGLSATFDKDHHYLIFGAPGAYNWKGMVRLEQKNLTIFLEGTYDDGPFETGDENQKNPALVPVPPSSYLGFSLDSGMNLVRKGELSVVAGAPRANHSGAVLLMKAGLKGNMVREFTLEGEGLASSFGYDVLVLDLNEDGWEDIVVGAPQYFEKDGKIGGAVYVYINQDGAWDRVTPLRIDGPEDSMFGLVVETLGDINQDRFPDFAVGAPYDDGGAGVVYIYHGSKDGVRSKKASQVLKGQPLGAHQFGYSLAGNMDLDMNSYPDLAVGSLSDSVFVYRARPVVDINKEITISPKELDLTKNNCDNHVCLTITACFNYVSSVPNYNPRLTVQYSLVVDAARRLQGLPSRVAFSPGLGSDGTVVLAGQQDKKCLEWKLTVQDNIKDKLRGIPIEVSVEIGDSKRRRRQTPGEGLPPILDANKPTSISSEVSFLKEGCGADNECQSNLVVKHRYCSKKPNQDVFPPLQLDAAGVPLVLLSDQKEIALEITVTNHKGDDAHEASVQASFPSSLTYSALSSKQSSVTCTANKNGSYVDCEIGNPFKSEAKVTFYIILSTSGISLNTTDLEINLQLNTTSEQKKLEPIKARAKVKIELLLSLLGQAQPSQVYYTGAVKGETAMKTESDIGTAIKYQFRIINLGKPLTNLGSASLDIHWPKETSDGKWLLYIMDISSTGVKKVACSPGAEVNPHDIKKEDTGNRRRRAADDKSKSEGSIALLLDKRKNETLSCARGAGCVEFHCPLEGLDSNAAIMINARLWNSTFIEKYSKLNYLDVIVKATLRVSSAGQNMILKNSETQVKVTVFPERKAFQQGGLPWWIFMVAIFLGLLLLALLLFLLWKCGFFQTDDSSDTKKLTADA